MVKETLGEGHSETHCEQTHGQGAVGQERHLLQVAALSQCALKRPTQQAAQPRSAGLHNSLLTAVMMHLIGDYLEMPSNIYEPNLM